MTMQTALVPFHHDTVQSTYDDEQKIDYCVPRHVCLNIGLDWPSQYKALLNDEILSEQIIHCDITTDSLGDREAILLPVKYLPGWLFKIQPNRVKDEIRPKLLLYQYECYEVLHAYWLNGGVAVNPRTQPLDGDLQAIQNLLEALQETRIEAREAHIWAEQARLGVAEHSHLFGDIQESTSDLESRVAQLEFDLKTLRATPTTEDTTHWLDIYDFAKRYHPDLLRYWRTSKTKKDDFRATAKRLGNYEYRYVSNDAVRSFLYCSRVTFEAAYHECTRRWKLKDAVSARRQNGAEDVTLF